MAAKLRLVFTITILFASFWAYSQDNYWTSVNRADKASKDFIKESDFSQSQVFSVNEEMLSIQLKGLSEIAKNKVKVYFPDETGDLKAFYVQESSVLAPDLAAKYPQIKSYSGYGVEDLISSIRFSVSHNGLQVTMVHAEKSNTTFIQKTSKNNYVVYTRNGLSKKDSDFICETTSKFTPEMSASTRRPVDGKILRKYRLAVSASGDYTEFHGGTVADALAAINATLTRINQVFETDLGLTLELVANNDEIIFTDGASDPYSSGDSLNGQTQTTLTNIIGEANYDIGHLLHQGANGGNAGFIGELCTDGRKGSAYSSGVSPVGDTYDIDFVAHEIGHQLGANHTWSFESEGTGVQVEPASGTTIMGYAGITGANNVALNSDDYFHIASIVQITANLETKACGEVIALTNNPPVVNSIANYVVPVLTAFKLTGSASDPDAGNQLSYTWEQINSGVVTQSTFGPNNAIGANFRSIKPSADPSRYFPALENVVSGNLTQEVPAVNSAWETATAINRKLNFAFTVRDNAIGGGQVVSELVEVEVKAAGGPFLLTTQSSSENYTAGELVEVNWDVAGTNLAPINVQTVDILLSIDGGETFPIVLAEQVVNDGSHQIVLPGATATEARIMIKANENIFFAVNAADFVIAESSIVLNPSQTAYEACRTEDVSIPFVYETYSGFSEEVTFEVLDLPTGMSASFSPATASANDTQVVLTIASTVDADLGDYTITIKALGASQEKELPLQLTLYGGEFPAVNLLSPVDESNDVSVRDILEWEANEMFTSYDIQIASDANFANLVETASLFTTSYKPSSLANDTVYFWRIKPKNGCGEGDFGSAFKFTTLQINCLPTRSGEDLPISISTSVPETISSKLTIFEDFPLVDISVGISLEHSYLSDMIITLTAPSGKSINLLSNSCGDLRNINAVFNDSAANFVCGGDPAISGMVSPVESFDSLRGDSVLGEWTLTVADLFNGDGGFLNDFYIEFCVEGEPQPDADADGVSDADDICPNTPPGVNVDITGCPIYRFSNANFQLKTTSESCRTENDGILEIQTVESLDYTVSITGNGLNVSDTFTTSYTQNNLSAGTYTVCFDATDGDKEYEVVCFDIVISEPEALSVSSKSGADPNSILLSLDGSDSYFITFNGLEIQTSKSEYNLNLRPGNNVVKVTGSLQCQGSYEEQFFVASGIIIYPNPATNYIKLFVENAEQVDMSLYTIEGRLIREERVTSGGTELQLDVSTLSTGTYFLKVESKMQKGTYKIIKQ